MKTNSISADLTVHARTITTTRHLIFRRAWLWTGFLAFTTIAFGPQRAQAVVTEAWVQRYGSEAESEDYAYKVVSDAAGNVIVAGSTANQIGGESDMLIIKYSGAGVPLWTNRCNGSASAVAVDGPGNVFVAGYSSGSGGADYATIAYSGAGVPLWTNRYNGPGNNSYDKATAVAVDGSGSVFVTGNSAEGGGATIAYSGAGVPLWTNRYNGPANGWYEASAVAVDASGSVFVTGNSTGSGDATIAYSGAGVPLWTNRYNGTASAVAVDGSGNVFVTGSSATIAYSDAGAPLWTNGVSGTAIALDASGNVFVTGSSFGSGGNVDYATIAYSGAGVPLWTNRYNGTANSYDGASAVAVDGSGNVFVTGYSFGSGGNVDYATIAYSGAGVPLWTNRFNGPANSYDGVSVVAVDASGNVFVTGSSVGSGGDSDFATIAYSGVGVPLWTNRYGGRKDASDIANAVAVDVSGNVFVTGWSGYEASRGVADYATIAYSSAGVPFWTNRYNGPANSSDQATAVVVDASGNVFVTGYSFGGDNSAYATIAYSGAGVPLWTNRYNGSASAVVVDGNGNVFVTGSSPDSRGNDDYATIAYSGAGVPLWTNRYNGPANFYSDQATAVAVDGSGNVFVTGTSLGILDNNDYATIAYSGAGVPLWTNRYNGPHNGHDQATAVVGDASGNVFVTGSSSGSAGGSDYATIAYSGAGVPLWTNRYNGPGTGRDNANAVAVDASGNVFVTGSSSGSAGGSDYATIAYSGAGVPLWTNRYNGPAYGYSQATAVAVDRSGNVFVTGFSGNSGFAEFNVSDYVTIAYSGAGVPLCTNRYNVPGTIRGRFPTKSSLAIGSDGAVYVIGGDFATVKYVWRTEIAIQLLSSIPPKVNLTLSGAPNSSWAIERALDLTGPWANLSALRIGTNGSAQLQDTNSPYPAGFYRARQ